MEEAKAEGRDRDRRSAPTVRTPFLCLASIVLVSAVALLFVREHAFFGLPRNSNKVANPPAGNLSPRDAASARTTLTSLSSRSPSLSGASRLSVGPKFRPRRLASGLATSGTLCDGGKYWDNRQAACADCPAGTFSFYGSVGIQRCMACPFGFYSSAGAAVCDACDANMSFKPALNAAGGVSCEACEPLFEYCYRTSPTDDSDWWSWSMVCSSGAKGTEQANGVRGMQVNEAGDAALGSESFGSLSAAAAPLVARPSAQVARPEGSEKGASPTMFRGSARLFRSFTKQARQGDQGSVEHPFCETLRNANPAGLNFRLKCRKRGVCTGVVASPCTEGNTGVLCDRCDNGYTLPLLEPTASSCTKCSGGLMAFLGFMLLCLCFVAGLVVWLARGNDATSFNRNIVIIRIFVVHMQLLNLLRFRASAEMDSVAKLWNVLVLTIPIESLVECLDTFTEWSGTTFTFVIVGLFFPIFNLICSLAVGGVLRKLHVRKLKQEMTQSVTEDVYLNPALHAGTELTALAREAEERREQIKARVAKRAEDAAQRRKAAEGGPVRPGAFVKKGKGKKVENAEGLPRAAMAAKDVQERRAKQLEAKRRKAEKKKKPKRERGLERRIGVQEDQEREAKEGEGDTAWKAQGLRQPLQAPDLSDSYYSSSFQSSEQVESGVDKKEFQPAAAHASAPVDGAAVARARGDPNTKERDQNEEPDDPAEGGGGAVPAAWLAAGPGKMQAPDAPEAEVSEDEEAELDAKKPKKPQPVPAMPTMHTADLYGYWKWVFAVFFVLHYSCLVTIGTLLFKGIFCVTDDVIPGVSYEFLAADFSLQCSSASTFTISATAGIVLWLVLLPAGHFYFMSRRLGDDIWLTDQYSLFCSWPVYGFRSGYRITYGLQVVAVILVLVVTSTPISHGRLERSLEAPGGIVFSFSFLKIITSTQIIICINIIGLYLIFLFIAHPYEPAKFVLSSHLAVLSCAAAIALYIYTYYQNIAPGTSVASGIGIVAFLLQIIFFLCAGVCALVESGFVKQTRNRFAFVDEVLAAASNTIKHTGTYRALQGDGEEQDVQERWEALRMDRASKEAQRNQQARHARLGVGDAAPGAEEIVVERAAILRLTSKKDHVALLDAVTACNSVPRALAAFERLTFLDTFPTMEKPEARAALEKLGFDVEELDGGLKLFLKHRNAMMRVFSRFSVSSLSEAFACGWELGLLRYSELDDVTLELASTKQKADRLLQQARAEDIAHMGRRGAGLYREDVREWNVLKAEACRITLQCLLLDLSDHHFHIARELPRRRFLATGTDQDAEDIRVRRVVDEDATGSRAASEDADAGAFLRLASLEEEGETAGFRAGLQLYEFAEAEPKRLRRKRLLEQTYALYRDFKLIFPNALPCIDRAPEARAQERAKASSPAAGPGRDDPLGAVKSFQLHVLGHHISAEDGRDVFFRGNFRAVAGPSGDLTGLDLSQNPRSVIVLDPPVALHARYAIECWVLLPLPPPSASASSVGIYRSLCADSDGDVICCLRQGPSRTAQRRREREAAEGDYKDAVAEKKEAAANRQLHFGLFLFPERDEEESVASDVASNCGSDAADARTSLAARGAQNVETGDLPGGDLGFFEAKAHASEKARVARADKQLQAGWHHLVVSRCESGTSYYWDGECVGSISALALPFAGFHDIAAIGNTRDGGHVCGALSDFAVFATHLDDEAAKLRYSYLQRHLVGKATAGQGLPPAQKRESGAADAGRYGLGTAAPGALAFDLLVDVYFIPASSRKTWALCAASPEQMKAITYRRESSREQPRKAGAAGSSLKRCEASGKGGVALVSPGPSRGATERAHGGSTANGSCVALDPAVEVDRELVPVRAWTVFAWIYTPLPQTEAAHVLVAGEADFHVCVLKDQRSVGVMYCAKRNARGEGTESSTEASDASDDASVDSDGCQREEYPSGFDIRDLAKGWHHLCVVANEAGQAFYADGTLRGYLPKSTWEDIRFLGNAATGNKPWGTFAQVSIYGKYFGAAEVASEYAKYRVDFPDPVGSRRLASKGPGDETLTAGDSSQGENEEDGENRVDSFSQPDDGRAYKGYMSFQICSDGESVVLLPQVAAQKHDIRVFHIDEFAVGVSGQHVAFDCVRSLALERQRRQVESGGGIRIHPAVSCKRAWTIVGWIQTPIENTGMFHALVGGKDGDAHVAVDRDGETLARTYAEHQDLIRSGKFDPVSSGAQDHPE
ncbi:conserved hypothetical protein [Neospora caninum Liverpool]|uniref:Tyrosine-protein kinase ephrin type A/B receptor-like domain-containing protein n=1 Tax=Neospora caninum (strain Liverpool) TaxID=572307 RepID=F0VKX6_NEOCL|nr:conserved hypothetical protein [Neospora caninum Liverpool]CBZ54727.1 conserved hypothetical protein [Neospora caninum Liverpool]|eukprot:XP_003884757.1 conserved hypothetical protein [Neospora caninum Liverpool]